MGKQDAEDWAAIVAGLGKARDLRYEAIGGLNPVGEPAALCPGGTNRLTGQLADGFWGASCDADEVEQGGLFSKSVVPRAVLAKAHMPDLAEVMPQFDVESIEKRPDEMVLKHVARKVEFESIDFNRRFLATVPKDHDPVALRELFSPGFLSWVTTISNEIDFGVSDRQLFFHWHLAERSRDEMEKALTNAGRLFERVRREMVEHGIAAYPAGPWHAGMEPFPESPTRPAT